MREGMGGEIQQQQKEDLHAGQNYRSVGEEARIGFVAQAQDESVGREQQRPEQQRTFLAGPQHGELVRAGKIAIAVMEDVGDGEVVLEGADDEDKGSEKDCGEGGDAGAAGGFADAFRAPAEHCDQPVSFGEKVRRWRGMQPEPLGSRPPKRFGFEKLGR